MQENPNDIVIFLIIVSLVIVSLIAFVIIILYLYRKKQIQFFQSLEQMKLDHEKQILKARLEMQEQTFQHISREIHDNISLSLTLAKLHLNTLTSHNIKDPGGKIKSAVELIGRSLLDLSDISRSLNADIIIRHGLINALEGELQCVQEAGNMTTRLEISGTPTYLEAQKELIIFRIIQEAFNNIIKHAFAKNVLLGLDYSQQTLHISISDNGIGFNTDDPAFRLSRTAGLKNMEARIQMINGTMKLKSEPGLGTSISLFIPLSA